MSNISSGLRTRQSRLAHDLIVHTAIDLLINEPQESLSVRAVALNAGMSERTVFRYFATRDHLLDAVAAEMAARQALPSLPDRLDQLPDYPAVLFSRFEEIKGMVQASLRSEVYERIRTVDLLNRGESIAKLVDEAAAGVDAGTRKIVARNIHYFLVATTWNYYRTRFGLSAEEAVAAARRAIKDAIAGLQRDNRA